MIVKGKSTKYIIAIVAVLVVGAVLAVAGAKLKTDPKGDVKQVENPTQQTNQQISTSLEVDDPILEDWKTYTNDEFGFSFQYPSTWSKTESNSINLQGVVTSRNINFIDTASETTLLIEYHLAPYGKALFEKTLGDFNSSKGIYANAQKTEVARSEAIEVSVTKTEDIKGNVYDPPLKEIFIDFLDEAQMGSVHMYFRTLLTSADAEISKFKKLISTFEFLSAKEKNLSYSVAFYKGPELFTIPVTNGIKPPEMVGDEVLRPIKTSNYYTYSIMPKDVIGSIPISDGMVFYSALRSPMDSNTWLFVERNMNNNSYNLCLFDSGTHSKKILFTQDSSPDKEYAFNPIAWSDQRDLVYIEALIFGSATENEGIWSYDITNNIFMKKNMNPNYLRTPVISPDFRYFVYGATDGQKGLHSMANQILLYDLQANKEILLVKDEQTFFSGIRWVEK